MLKRGFTLVEMIIVVALVSVFFEGVAATLGSIQKIWWAEARKRSDRQIEMIVSEKIARDIRKAKAILPGSSSTEVVLAIGSEVISYRLINQKVRRGVGANISYLTNEKEIERLIFNYQANRTVELAVNDRLSRAALRN